MCLFVFIWTSTRGMMSIETSLDFESSSTKTKIRSSAGDVNGETTTVYNKWCSSDSVKSSTRFCSEIEKGKKGEDAILSSITESSSGFWRREGTFAAKYY